MFVLFTMNTTKAWHKNTTEWGLPYIKVIIFKICYLLSHFSHCKCSLNFAFIASFYLNFFSFILFHSQFFSGSFWIRNIKCHWNEVHKIFGGILLQKQKIASMLYDTRQFNQNGEFAFDEQRWAKMQRKISAFCFNRYKFQH